MFSVFILAMMALFGVFIFFQIILPLYNNTPLLPFFSEREKVGVEIDQELEIIDVNLEKDRLKTLKAKSSKEQKDEETV